MGPSACVCCSSQHQFKPFSVTKHRRDKGKNLGRGGTWYELKGKQQPKYALFHISKQKKTPQSTTLPTLSHGTKVKIGYWKNVSFLILFPWVIWQDPIYSLLQQGTDRLLESFNTRSRVHLSTLLVKKPNTLFPVPHCMKNKLCAMKRLLVNSFAQVIHWFWLKIKV